MELVLGVSYSQVYTYGARCYQMTTKVPIEKNRQIKVKSFFVLLELLIVEKRKNVQDIIN